MLFLIILFCVLVAGYVTSAIVFFYCYFNKEQRKKHNDYKALVCVNAFLLAIMILSMFIEI